jgi:hypothetical protein
MTKAELRKFQAGTRRRFILALIVLAFAMGLLVAWVFPSAIVWVLSVTSFVLAAMVFESHIRQSRFVKKSPRKKSLPSNSIMMKRGVTQ